MKSPGVRRGQRPYVASSTTPPICLLDASREACKLTSRQSRAGAKHTNHAQTTGVWKGLLVCMTFIWTSALCITLWCYYMICVFSRSLLYYPSHSLIFLFFTCILSGSPIENKVSFTREPCVYTIGKYSVIQIYKIGKHTQEKQPHTSAMRAPINNFNCPSGTSTSSGRLFHTWGAKTKHRFT
jgi:hypothetical protein